MVAHHLAKWDVHFDAVSTLLGANSVAHNLAQGYVSSAAGTLLAARSVVHSLRRRKVSLLSAHSFFLVFDRILRNRLLLQPGVSFPCRPVCGCHAHGLRTSCDHKYVLYGHYDLELFLPRLLWAGSSPASPRYTLLSSLCGWRVRNGLPCGFASGASSPMRNPGTKVVFLAMIPLRGAPGVVTNAFYLPFYYDRLLACRP